jgi:hypothetical protein
MATYTVHKSLIQVIGKIWMPPVVCGMQYDLTEHDVQNIHPLTYDNVEDWLMKHSGDFQEIIDFRADIYDSVLGIDVVFEWEDPESEYTYFDLMYSSED